MTKGIKLLPKPGYANRPHSCRVRRLALVGFAACCLSSLSCQALFHGYDPRLAPDYFTSRSAKIVKARKTEIVEYAVGDVYVNKRELYFAPSIWEVPYLVDRKPYGGKCQTIPVGTRFEITAVKADFGINGGGAEPYFRVEGLTGKWFTIVGFEETASYQGYGDGLAQPGMKHGYNRENFRRVSSGVKMDRLEQR